MLGNKLINTNAGGGCTNTVDLYNPFPDGGGVALYQLNGDATDESGNYDGTASNVTYGAGEFGQAGVFNGSSSYIDTTYTIPASSTYSISAWFKTSTTGTQELIIADFDASGSGLTVRFTLGFISSNNFYINMGNGSSSWSNYTINALPYRDGNWHNIVTVWNGTNVKLYADGNTTPIADLTSTVSAGAAGTSPLNFGRAGDVSGSYFNGSIDQVRIFNRALRPYEVEALYTEEYCTPTIVPSEHFNTVLYTGNGSTQSVTGVGFQPDFTWIKDRFVAEWHGLMDSVRGSSQRLYSNATNAEDSGSDVTSFDSDGFSLTNNNNFTNRNGDSYVAWNFKAGGAAVTNPEGNTTSQISANPDAGFSVVEYTAGGTANVGHGLDSAPAVIITKNLDISEQWFVYHKDVGTQKFLGLNTTSAAISNSGVYTSITDTTYTNNISSTSRTYINYCFSEVEGFSNFGSYVGTGASGNTVVTGFEPAFVMVKSSSDAFYWYTFDNKRNISNPRNSGLFPNDSLAEITSSNYNIDFNSNGFTLQNGSTANNNSGSTYIYMAFAADPTTIEPSLEDSFNTVTWTSTGGNTNISVTGVGFQPDLVWAKARTDAYSHTLYDSVRGAGSSHWLSSNVTNSESSLAASAAQYGYLGSFDDDGFTGNAGTSDNSYFNYNTGKDYVAWCWKGAELPAINSNGSIPSVVSANPAAGFSIVSYTGNGANGDTVGHGLSAVPNVVIWKNRSDARNWVVWHSGLTSIDYSLILNSASAEVLDSRTNRPFGQPTDSVLVLGEDNETNFSPNKFIAYCFADVAGFSKFGSYSGGSTGSGNVINTGFKPLFLMVKRTDIAGDAWQMFDTVRGGGDTFDNYVQANTSAAEVSYNQREVNFTNNGFYWTFAESGTNISGGTYIYMAFANQF